MKPKGSQFSEIIPKATHWEGKPMTADDIAEGKVNIEKAGGLAPTPKQWQDNTYGVTLSDGWGPWLTDEEKSV